MQVLNGIYKLIQLKMKNFEASPARLCIRKRSEQFSICTHRLNQSLSKGLKLSKLTVRLPSVETEPNLQSDPSEVLISRRKLQSQTPVFSNFKLDLSNKSPCQVLRSRLNFKSETPHKGKVSVVMMPLPHTPYKQITQAMMLHRMKRLRSKENTLN